MVYSGLAVQYYSSTSMIIMVYNCIFCILYNLVIYTLKLEAWYSFFLQNKVNSFREEIIEVWFIESYLEIGKKGNTRVN